MLCAFLEAMKLYVEPPLINPAVKYCETLTPVLSAILTSFVNNSHITEQVCRCYRTMLISYRNNMISLLPSLATQLVTGFESSHDGVFLYVTSSIIREFADEADNDPSLKQGIYECFQRQSIALLRFLSGNPVRSIPDVLEDFFRLAIDAEMYYPDLFLVSELFTHIFDAAIVALDSEVMGTLAPVLHFLRDILDFGKASADTSAEPPPMAVAVQGVIAEKGEILVTKIIGGLTSGFPRDCIPDGSGVLLDALSMLPEPAARWIMKAIHMLPSGSVSPPEMQKLASGLESGLDREDFRKVRTLLQGGLHGPYIQTVETYG